MYHSFNFLLSLKLFKKGGEEEKEVEMIKLKLVLYYLIKSYYRLYVILDQPYPSILRFNTFPLFCITCFKISNFRTTGLL